MLDVPVPAIVRVVPPGGVARTLKLLPGGVKLVFRSSSKVTASV